jgi:TfoX/Sxy family transcriptional regulator of competence genes
MPYSQTLANRIREKLSHLPNIEEKSMMGGLVFMYNDKMLVGIMKDELMCRIDPELHEMAVEKNGCRTMDFGNQLTKRIMKGYILVDETGMKNEADLDYWIHLSLDYNPKANSSKKKKKKG